MTSRKSTKRRNLRRARTLSEIERDFNKDVEQQLYQPAPPEPLLRRPSSELRALERALVSDVYEAIFSRTQARAVRACLREIAAKRTPRASAGWVRGIAGPRHDPVNYGWEEILRAAQLFELDKKLDSRKIRLSRERTQKSGLLRPLIEQYGRRSPLVRSIEHEFGPGRPHNVVDSYVWQVCSVYEALGGRKVRPGKDGRLRRLLRACLAPELFWGNRQPMSDWAINSSVRHFVGTRPPTAKLGRTHRLE